MIFPTRMIIKTITAILRVIYQINEYQLQERRNKLNKFDRNLKEKLKQFIYVKYYECNEIKRNIYNK